jgi:hypothetical protein
MGFCPLQLAGTSDGVYFYYGLNCPGGNTGGASANRMHQLGVNCSNIVDQIGACGDVEHVCGCEADGIKEYVTLREKFKPQKHAKLLGQCTVAYKDGKRQRKARLFIVQSKPPGKTPHTLRVGLELAPTAKLPADGCFQATLAHKKGCYHSIRLDGLDHHFHVITKGGGKARGKGGAKKRARAAR